ncbi:MAG: FAD-binding oxidoreductase [Deltaproteobacteria bacterium]|nr:FAD-binding oxidoreductase [Deltaproteobacteria bacterium]
MAANQEKSVMNTGNEALSSGIRELESLGVRVKHVEKPAKEREAQQILARAFQEKLTVFPCGGGTALGSGVLPETVDIALDTTGMNRVLAFDPLNLNLAVLAGMTLDAINSYLAGQGKGFFLPLDPPLPNRATIGGVYAANGSGPLRLRYGIVRDQALGVRGADARGNEVGFGGKTVKNVSGYDLTKFFIGSAGSLCLITSISFRIYPLPDAASVCDLILGSLEELEKFLSALRVSTLVPSAVVVAPASGVFRVLAGFEGHPQAVDRESKDLLDLASQFGGAGESRAEREALMKALQSAVDPPGADPGRLALKITVPIAQGPRTLGAIGKVAKECGLVAKTALFAGNGVILLYAAAQGDTASRLINEVKELGRSAGGYTAPIRLQRTLLSGWGSRVDPALHQFVLKPIKEKLDPSGVFPPIV